MKNLFLVLSDIHMREDQKLNKLYIDNIFNVLNSIDKVDNACVIVAGDLAFSGKRNEYRRVGNLFGLISNQIRKKLERDDIIPYYIVPGNHDIDYNGEARDREAVIDLHNSGKIDLEIEDDFRWKNWVFWWVKMGLLLSTVVRFLKIDNNWEILEKQKTQEI